MSVILVDYDEGRKQGHQVENLGAQCAALATQLSACGESEFAGELKALEAELAAIGKDLVEVSDQRDAEDAHLYSTRA